ncbi:hypothetical protein CLV58_109171 [Spirosoma oryzae]|uniref:Uncharacterized protein n=1 Tax=Spirosoma oryzae TaxID=1469603 RepID=A0A2T0SYG4_9BACT|nr:hypothetical protein [Spirosoma oryzae]PRY38444.1 hypothetical protein CLV58_109171 [Spirosoma oryzae]
MGKIPLSIQNAPGPATISVKLAGDATERYTGYTDGYCYFNAPQDAQTHTYTLQVNAGSCQTAQTFSLYCGAPQTCSPPNNVYRFAVPPGEVRYNTADEACQGVCSGTTGNEGGHPVDYLGVGGKIFDNFVNCTAWNNTGWFPVHQNPGDPFTQIVQVQNGIIQALQSCPCGNNDTQPSFTLSARNPTCDGSISSGLLLTGIQRVDRYRYTSGTSYTGPIDCQQGTPLTSANGSFLIDIPAPAPGNSNTYTVRGWNTANCGQWWDQTVTVTAPVCQTGPAPMTVTAFQPSCQNGQITGGGFSIRNGDRSGKFRYCYGSSFGCTSDCSAPDGYLQNGSVDYGLSFNSRSSGYNQDVTIRVYKGDCSSFTDTTLTFSVPACNVPCTPSEANVSERYDGKAEIKNYSYQNTNCVDQTVYVAFNPFSIPDKISLFIDGRQVFTSGCLGDDVRTGKTVLLHHGETLRVEVDGTCSGNSGTLWQLVMSSKQGVFGQEYTPVNR